ncbi:MAG: hypothetical protein FWD15_05610 [Alphaproteobacteria bacterium]|nr:hypothetical protein [Alphaproteobacteria bacterium]
MFNIFKKSEGGNSLPQLFGAIAITGGIVAAGVKGVQEAMAQVKSAQLQSRVFELYFVIKEVYTSKKNSDKVVNLNEELEKIYELEILNPYHGRFIVESVPTGRDNLYSPEHIAITVDSVPTMACVNLVNGVRRMSACTSTNGFPECIKIAGGDECNWQNNSITIRISKSLF